MQDVFTITMIARLAGILITIVSRAAWQALSFFDCVNPVQAIIH